MTTLTRMKPAAVESSLPNFSNEMNRFLSDAFHPRAWAPASPWNVARVTNGPALDVMETPESYIVTAEIPGLTAEEVEAQVEGTSLTIRGTKRPPQIESAETLVRECAYGGFSRTISLPGTIQSDEVSASYSHGVVTVTVPKSDSCRARRVDVQNAN